MKFNTSAYATHKTETEENTITLSVFTDEGAIFTYHQWNKVTGDELWSEHEFEIQVDEDGMEYLEAFGVRIYADANCQQEDSQESAILNKFNNVEPTNGYGEWDSYDWNTYWGQIWEYNNQDEYRVQFAVNKFNEFTLEVQKRIITDGVKTLHGYVINK